MNPPSWRTRLGIPCATMVAAGALLASAPATAQMPRASRTGFWATAAIGPTAPYGIGIAATAAVRYTRIVLRVRYASSGEFAGDWFEDVGMLVGVVVTPTSQRGQLAVGAGVGHTRCRHCGFLVTQSDRSPSPGFLVDAEGRLALTRFLGATAYIFGDLNSSLSFGGVAVGLFVGRL